MKLIIDIPDNEYKYTCERTLSDRTFWDDAIRNGIPLDDVKAENKGEWLLLADEEMTDVFDFFYKGDSWMNYKCSECGHKVHNELKGNGDNRTNFCPNCGADMRPEPYKAESEE